MASVTGSMPVTASRRLRHERAAALLQPNRGFLPPRAVFLAAKQTGCWQTAHQAALPGSVEGVFRQIKKI
jgi:hypothetical protein